MSLLQGFRLYLYRQQLKQALASHRYSRSSIDLATATTIGLLFNGMNDWEVIEDFVQQLERQGKQVFVLGYLESDLATEAFPYFNAKQLKWSYVPTDTEAINTFLERHFDLLINVDRTALPSIAYISALTKASLKIGAAPNKTDYYDLIIDLPDQQGCDALLEQVLFYLQRIHTTKQHEVSAL